MPPVTFESQQDLARMQQTSIDVAVLKEQVGTLGREMAELKRVNASQSEKLDRISEQLTEARGGLRTVLYMGGAMAAVGGAVVWILERLLAVKP